MPNSIFDLLKKNKDEQAREPNKQKLCKNRFLVPFESAIPDNIGDIKDTIKNEAERAYEYNAVFTNSLPKNVTVFVPLFDVTADQYIGKIVEVMVRL
jgi:hypothetical protein